MPPFCGFVRLVMCRRSASIMWVRFPQPAPISLIINTSMVKRKYYHPQDGCNPPREFTTDGCSGGMSWFWQTCIKPFTKTDIPWRECCVVHDRAYWMGGTWRNRRTADRQLRKCVGRAYPTIGWLMYFGVRMGGSPFWPVSWRWGYGWKKGLIERFTGWK